IKLDLIERKICVLDFLRENRFVVAILASEGGRLVGTYGKFPKLEAFGGNALVVGLDDRDFIQEPIGSGCIGNVLGSVCEQHLSVDGMAIPMLAAGELAKGVFCNVSSA